MFSSVLFVVLGSCLFYALSIGLPYALIAIEWYPGHMLMLGKVSHFSGMYSGSVRSIFGSRPHVHSRMSFVAVTCEAVEKCVRILAHDALVGL
jgi:hypothetical protein